VAAGFWFDDKGHYVTVSFEHATFKEKHGFLKKKLYGEPVKVADFIQKKYQRHFMVPNPILNSKRTVNIEDPQNVSEPMAKEIFDPTSMEYENNAALRAQFEKKSGKVDVKKRQQRR
jgi:hypothetical protein